MLKLSIIIPYYNTYDLTIKLIKELEIQKTDEVEIILIDDGCNESRFDNYNFINVIHNKTNLGATCSWNIGIKAAQGEYIAFIDSDDMVVPYYIEELLKAIDEEKADEIQFGWLDRTENIHVSNPINVAIWKAIYKRKICPLFRENYKYQSDIPFQKDLAKINHTKCLLHKTLYLYNSKRVGGLTWERINSEKERIRHSLLDMESSEKTSQEKFNN